MNAFFQAIAAWLSSLFHMSESSPIPSNMSGRAAFVDRMRAAMARVNLRGMASDLLLVLFSLETGDGSGDIFQHTNNPGSIKSTVGWAGRPSYKNTRVYATLEEGVADAVRLIAEKYPKAHVAATRRDFVTFFYELEAGGWEVHQDPPYRVRLANRAADLRRTGAIA